jgi:hypothetical protein
VSCVTRAKAGNLHIAWGNIKKILRGKAKLAYFTEDKNVFNYPLEKY